MKGRTRMIRGLFFALAFCASFALADAEPGYWKDALKIRKGVKLKELSFTEPRLMRAYMMRINLKTPGIVFTGTKRDPKWGEPMPDYTNAVREIRTRRETTVDFMKRLIAEKQPIDIAVNTTPWSPFIPSHKWANPGHWVVTDGIEVSPGRQSATFSIGKDGTPRIGDVRPLEETAYAHDGFLIIARGGKDIAPASETSVHPRTAFGLSADKKFLYLLVVDGRQPGYSIGADMHDLCRMFFAAGAADAVNMDGGGSTSLVYRDPVTKRPVMVNHHAGNAKRPVAANFGIGFKTEK